MDPVRPRVTRSHKPFIYYFDPIGRGLELGHPRLNHGYIVADGGGRVEAFVAPRRQAV